MMCMNQRNYLEMQIPRLLTRRSQQTVFEWARNNHRELDEWRLEQLVVRVSSSLQLVGLSRWTRWESPVSIWQYLLVKIARSSPSRLSLRGDSCLLSRTSPERWQIKSHSKINTQSHTVCDKDAKKCSAKYIWPARYWPYHPTSIDWFTNTCKTSIIHPTYPKSWEKTFTSLILFGAV